MIKALMKLGIEEIYLKIIKVIYGKFLNTLKWENFSFKIKGEARVSTLSTLYSLEFITREIR
jgi:hypothetical protein